MRRTLTCLPLLFVFLLSFSSPAKAQIHPTTTLATQTGNNTSAANSFSSQSDGNLGAGNVSKVDIHSLLYPGATTRIYAHLVPWFGGSNHMNVGYSSTDPAQVHRQIADMISRGIDGVIIDWYGPGSNEDIATKLVMAEAEKHPRFAFAVMVDKGAIPRAGCGTCSAQQALIDELNYIARSYYGSSAYMRWGGRPMVTNFDLDLHYSINWNAVRSAVAGNPALIFQHADGFTHPQTSGSYSWVILASDYGMSYLSKFYDAGLAHPSEDAYGAAYKGFNDSLASWGSGRVMSQQCGQTWLQTFSKINSMYNSSRQLDALQLVTWNDYEEGTEIETGIDNCLGISASISGGTLKWSVQGNENTLDHYTVFISSDGRNLAELARAGAGNHSINLGSYSLAAGNYTLYVQAVGKPVFRNHMSARVKYTARGSASSSSASITLAASPSTVTLTQGQSANLQVTVTATGTAVNSVALACSNLPSGTSCAFSPASVSPGSGMAATTLTIATGRLTASAGHPGRAVYALGLPMFGFAGLFLLEGGKRRKRALAVLAAALLVVACSCGGGPSPASPSGASQAAQQGSYAVIVSGSSSAGQSSTTITLNLH
ncbi:MAG TPA: hypothetical protein VGR48_04955 [Terriglobales bacterium]|nr:hypothetical protein [Terriglobales bacterium]